jgi:hypothetical protein
MADVDTSGSAAPQDWAAISAMMAQTVAQKAQDYGQAGQGQVAPPSLMPIPAAPQQAPTAAPGPMPVPSAPVPTQAAPVQPAPAAPATSDTPPPPPDNWTDIQSMMAQTVQDKQAAQAQVAQADAPASTGPKSDLGYIKNQVVTGLTNIATAPSYVSDAIGGIPDRLINFFVPGHSQAVADSLSKIGAKAAADYPTLTALTSPLTGVGGPDLNQRAQGFVRDQGLVDDTQPASYAGKLTGDAVGGLLNTVPMLPLGGAGGATGGGVSALAKAAVPAVVGGAGGTVGGDVASDAAASFGLGPRGQDALGLLGSLVGGGVGAKLGSAGMGQTSPGLQQLKDAGVNTLTPDLLSKFGGNTTGNIATLWGHLPFVDGPINAASSRAVGQVGDSLGRVADQIAPLASPTEIGSNIQTGIGNWVDQFKKTAAQNYGDAEAAIPAGATVAPTNTLDTLGLTTNAKGKLVQQPTTAVAETMVPQPIADLRDAFLKDKSTSMSYQDLKSLRTDIGNRLTSAAIVSDPAQGALKQLYGSLTSDLRTAVGQGGQPALDAFDKASQFYAQGLDTIQNRIGNLAKAGVTPETVYTQLTSPLAKGATRLSDLVDSGVVAPADLNLIARATMQKMGATSNGGFDAGQFFDAYSKMKTNNPEGANLLFNKGIDPAAAAQLDKLSDIASKLGATNSAASKMNAAGAQKTGLRYLISKGVDAAPALAAGAHSLANGAALGPAGIAGATIGAGTWVLGNLMASQPFLRFLSKPVTSPQAFATGLGVLGKMNPAIRDDLSTLSSQIDKDPSQN